MRCKDQIDWQWVEKLGRGVVAGKGTAWESFWEAIAGVLVRWARSPGFMGGMARRDEWRHDVVLVAWERLQKDDHRRLRAFFARPRDGACGRSRCFRSWLYRVFKNIAIDHLRSLPEYVRRRERNDVVGNAIGGEHRYWQSTVMLAPSDGARCDDRVDRVQVDRMLAFLDDSLDRQLREALELADTGARTEDIARVLGVDPRAVGSVLARARDRRAFRPAIELWCAYHSADEIASILGLANADHARRVVDAAKKLLRRRFCCRPDDHTPRRRSHRPRRPSSTRTWDTTGT